jgi:hypothetical protein
MTKEHGICPVCQGSKHMPCPDNLRGYGVRNGWYGYRASDDTVNCTNCGAQTMWGQATGRVPLRADGTACTHDYQAKNVGRCLTQYTCTHCGDRYQIDSSD